MKKRFVCFLLALCLVAALLPVSALAAGSVTEPWDSGFGTGIKAALVNGYELRIFGNGTYEEPAAGTAPWKGSASAITTVVIESGVTTLQPNADGTKPFASCPNMTAMTVQRDLDKGSAGALNVTTGDLPTALRVKIEVSGATAMPNGSAAQQWTSLIANVYVVEIKEGVTSIGSQAFYGCTHLDSVTIPSTVRSIGQQAFGNTGVANVTLKHDFTNPLTIGQDAFPAAVKLNVEITGGSASTWSNYSGADAQPWAQYRSNINDVTFSAGVSHIAAYAFASCNNLKNVKIIFNDPNDGTFTATKSFGANWLWNVDQKNYVINVQGISASKAFKEWSGDGDQAFVDKYQHSTFLEYKAEANSVTANWQNVIPGIKLEPKENKNFGEIEVGYSTVELYTVTVTNTGNTATGDLVIQLTGGNVSAFSLSKTRINSLALNASDTFTVSPSAGQKAGGYSSTVSVTNSNGDTMGSFAVSYYVGTDYTRAERFVKRLYKQVLNRTDAEITADAAGVAYWTNKIVNREMNAAEVAAGFFASQEAINFKRTDSSFVETLYRAMMDRNSDAGGLKNWVDQLVAGKTRSWVFKQFVDSAEFHNLCDYYTLAVGTIDYTKYNMGESEKELVISTNIANFVERLYTVALGRASDAAGKKDWCTQLTNKKNTGAGVAAGFFGSAEYRAKKVTDAQFLADLYRVMFDRVIDATGSKTWGDSLAAGKTRSWVFKQVCGSQEFINLCKSFGITAGTIDPAKYNMGTSTAAAALKEADAQAFVNRLYEKALNRSGSAAETKGWVDELLKGTSGAQVAISIYTSAEFTARGLSNSDFVATLYESLLGRTGTASEMAPHIKKLTDGSTRSTIFAGFCGSTEYKNRCKALNITPGTIKAASYTIR